jgi:hypothetical protein
MTRTLYPCALPGHKQNELGVDHDTGFKDRWKDIVFNSKARQHLSASL